MVASKTRIVADKITNQFIDNVNMIILNEARDKNDIPKFSGTTYYNNSYSNPTSSIAFANPDAIPADDLDLKNNVLPPIDIGGPHRKVNALLIYTTLCNITKNLTRVRNFTSSWYHKTQNSFALVATTNGKAVFRESLPSVKGVETIAENTATSGWKRSIDGSTIKNINVDNGGVEKGKRDAANSINQFLENLNNSWATASADAINYTFYSCHNNCHSNCHNSCHGAGRSRR